MSPGLRSWGSSRVRSCAGRSRRSCARTRDWSSPRPPITDQLGSAVYRIDPSSGHVTATIGLAAPPYGITTGAGSAWVTSPADNGVARIDPVAGQVIQSIAVGADPAAIAFGFGSVWVANKLESTVSRIDPGTGAVTASIPVGNGPAHDTLVTFQRTSGSGGLQLVPALAPGIPAP